MYPDMTWQSHIEEHSTSIVVFPARGNSSMNMRKPLDKPQLRDILQSTWPVLKTVKVIQIKEHPRNPHSPEEPKEHDGWIMSPEWDSETDKGR